MGNQLDHGAHARQQLTSGACGVGAPEAKILADLLDFGSAQVGMHVTAMFKQARRYHIDDRAVAAECARAGIEIHPLSKYGATEHGGLVFGFAGAARAQTRSSLEIVRRAILNNSPAGV